MGWSFIKSLSFVFLFPGLLVVYQNCSPMKASTDNESQFASSNEATFLAVSSIIESRCIRCHSAASPSNRNVSLNSFDEIILSGIIVPNRPQSSRLYSVISNGTMPPDGPLDQIEIDLIKVWIETGATGITGTRNNIPPTVNAGVDRVITLPQNSISLIGTATDSDGTISNTVWAQLSGPNTSTLTNKFSLQLNVSGVIAGTYIYELLVEDNQRAVVTDLVQLTVLPPVAPPPPPSIITFTQVNNTIIQSKCISCHSGATPTGNFSMANYNLVMSRIVAGNANNSIFYQKVLNNSMPKNGTPLNASEKKLIFDWIQAGALNN